MMRSLFFAASLLVLAHPARADEACRLASSNAAEIASLEECHQHAEAGDAEAQFSYALILWGGNDWPAKPKEGLDWFRRAARQGHVLARVVLGRFLSSEEVAPDLRNRPEGYAWWVVGGERDAAANLRQKLSESELAQGERMANEFKAAYGSVR